MKLIHSPHLFFSFLQTLHEKLIEELNFQIYVRSVQASTMQRTGSARLSRRDASVWGWTDASKLDKPSLSGSVDIVVVDFC